MEPPGPSTLSTSTHTRSPPAISVFEWATIAQHLLETQSQPASPGEELDDMPNRRHRHSNARALFNLMLTCRNLYNELPWAMPKWHLANLGLLVGCSEHWLKESFPAQGRAEANLALATDAPSASHGSERPQDQHQQRMQAHSDTDHQVQVWLERRFLAYSWLGMTWSSTCPYLQSRIMLSPEAFWADFSRYGRVAFKSLAAMHDWAPPRDLEEEQRQLPRRQEGHGHPQQQRAGDDNGDGDGGDDGDGSGDNDGDDNRVDGGRTHDLTRSWPAAFTLEATIHSSADATRLAELRGAFSNVSCLRMILQVRSPGLRLRIHQADTVHVNLIIISGRDSTVFEELSDISHIIINRATPLHIQRMRNVRMCTVRRSFIRDFSQLSSLQHLALRKCPFTLSDLAALAVPPRLEFSGCTSGVSVLTQQHWPTTAFSNASIEQVQHVLATGLSPTLDAIWQMEERRQRRREYMRRYRQRAYEERRWLQAHNQRLRQELEQQQQELQQMRLLRQQLELEASASSHNLSDT